MKKITWVYAVLWILAGIVSSCQIVDQELGQDLLPPGDNVLLHHDTLFDIHAYPISSMPLGTSELTFDQQRLMLMGNRQDSIVGSAVASFITQFNTNLALRSGPNMEVDTLLLYFMVQDYIGDLQEEITIRIYEFTERIYMDSVYYADYDVEGKYNPVPLVEKSVLPENYSRLKFVIEDQAFKDKFLALEDTTLVKNDSLFKNFFHGLYVTAESASPEGVIARVQLSHNETYLTLKYSSDSTQVDSVAGKEYAWGQFTIDPYFSQKVNLFEHDFSGTYLSTLIDNDSASTPYCYVQGMAGVNTRFSLGSLDEWLELDQISISSATLVFDVVPEEESGISYDDLPDRLMIGTILDNERFEPIYDYYVLLSNGDDSQFGGYRKAISEGLFFDTTYTYRFNMGLHFQSMVDGLKQDNDFILQLADGKVNPKISKLWSNLPAHKSRIRLEIAYLKL